MGIEWEINLDFDQAIADIQAKAPEALMKGAEYLRAAAVELTPVESGNLAGSAEARLTGPMDAEVFFPGPYARYQHYGLDFHHEKGQALYLEQPTITEADAIVQIIGDNL